MAKRRRNKFAGVDDIYLTRKNIAVCHLTPTIGSYGRTAYCYKTKYYPKTRKNLAVAKRIHGSIRYGR